MSQSTPQASSTRTTQSEPPLDVLAIAPHPDDLEITCGGTLALLVRQGYRVGIVDLTTGEPTPRGSEALRAAEAEAAQKVLQIPFRFQAGLPNRELMDTPANRYVVATFLRRWRPKIVLTPAGRTVAASPDHYQGQLLVEASRFYSQLTHWDDRFEYTSPYRVPHLVYALFPFDAEVHHYHATFVIDITTTLEQKMEAIRCYRSQFDEARFERTRQFVEGFNRAQGGRCGFAVGELFALPQPVGGSDFLSVVCGAAEASPAPAKVND